VFGGGLGRNISGNSAARAIADTCREPVHMKPKVDAQIGINVNTCNKLVLSTPDDTEPVNR
jgi:hypothetical protein